MIYSLSKASNAKGIRVKTMPNPCRIHHRLPILLIGLSLGCGRSALCAAPLTFDLRSHEDAVAIQFDVAKVGNASFVLCGPQVVMDSPHAVEYAVLDSGAARFVVYCTAGQK